MNGPILTKTTNSYGIFGLRHGALSRNVHLWNQYCEIKSYELNKLSIRFRIWKPHVRNILYYSTIRRQMILNIKEMTKCYLASAKAEMFKISTSRPSCKLPSVCEHYLYNYFSFPFFFIFLFILLFSLPF